MRKGCHDRRPRFRILHNVLVAWWFPKVFLTMTGGQEHYLEIQQGSNERNVAQPLDNGWPAKGSAWRCLHSVSSGTN